MKLAAFYLMALFVVIAHGEHIELAETRNPARPAAAHVAR